MLFFTFYREAGKIIEMVKSLYNSLTISVKSNGRIKSYSK